VICSWFIFFTSAEQSKAVPPLILASLRCKCRVWRLPGSVGVKWLTSLYCCHAAHYWFERSARWKAAVLLCIIHAQIPTCQGARDRRTDGEGDVGGRLCCVSTHHCVFKQASEWVHAHTRTCTVMKRQVGLCNWNQTEIVLTQFTLISRSLCVFFRHWHPIILPLNTQEFIGFEHISGFLVAWINWNTLTCTTHNSKTELCLKTWSTQCGCQSYADKHSGKSSLKD